METVYVDHTDGAVDFAKLQLPTNTELEIELVDPTLPSVTLQNFHLISATHITIGSNIAYALSEPIELPQSTVSYTGPVLDRMILPPGLTSMTVVETPKSGILSKTRLPAGLKNLDIQLTDTFSPVDEMNIPPGLLKLKVGGEHNCSLEMLDLPPSLTDLDTGASVQPVDRLKTRLFEVNVTSRSTRLVQVGDDPPTRFKERLTLTSSLPVVSEIHKLLPSLAGVSVILDHTMWQTVGHVWCKLLLEGRVRVQSLTIVNNMGQGCMRDFGEVMYRSNRLGRPLCSRLHVVGETFDYATSLRVAEAIHKSPFDMEVEVDFTIPFPKCVLHRVASVLGAGTRDEDLAYHSQDTNVGFQVDDNTLSFTKRVSGGGPLGDRGDKGDNTSEFSAGFNDDFDSRLEPGSSSEHLEFEGGETFEGGATPKPVTLYSWVNCGFCKKQDAIIEALLADGESDSAEKFLACVNTNRLADPRDADYERVKVFPTWVVNGVLMPGLKQEEEIVRILESVA